MFFLFNQISIFLVLFPKLSKFLTEWNIINLFPTKSLKFFKEFIELTINRRKSKEQYRNDFIQMMIEHDDKQIEEALSELKIETSSRKLMKKTLTNYEILSQAFMFLMAGSGTTSSTLNFNKYLIFAIYFKKFYLNA